MSEKTKKSNAKACARRRERNKKANRCINDTVTPSHDPPEQDSVRCRTCNLIHRGSAYNKSGWKKPERPLDAPSASRCPSPFEMAQSCGADAARPRTSP